MSFNIGLCLSVDMRREDIKPSQDGWVIYTNNVLKSLVIMYVTMYRLCIFFCEMKSPKYGWNNGPSSFSVKNILWKRNNTYSDLYLHTKFELTFTFTYLADAFIQSDLQIIHFLSVCVPGNRTHNLCAANAMLYHWVTWTHLTFSYVSSDFKWDKKCLF